MDLNESSWPQPHQSVLLPAEDHLVVELHVSKVLGYRESAQAVTRVVEISGPEDRIHHNNEHVQNHGFGIWLESVHGFVCVCVCVSRWCGTDLPGLSSRPPVGFWQHRRMYSCKACCSNIHRCWLSSDSPAQGKVPIKNNPTVKTNKKKQKPLYLL